MDTLTLCGWSAFQWHRIPPLVRMLHLSGIEDGTVLAALPDPDAGPLLGGIDYPLHVLSACPSSRLRRSWLASHVRTIPSLSRNQIVPIGCGLSVTDPAVTLATLASSLSPVRLALVASELAGSFSVYRPTQEEQVLIDLIGDGNISMFGDLGEDLLMEHRHGWQQCRDLKGRPSDLWKRKPLVSRDDLLGFASTARRVQGLKILKQATRYMLEGAASPLEVEVGILMGQPRRRGGESLGTAMCNLPIQLSPEARGIAGTSICYGDLCFRGPNGKLLDIECQGTRWHDGHVKGIRDNARSTALQCMGIEVMFITGEQLRDDAQAAEIARAARKKLGITLPDPSPLLLETRERLRREVLVDWKSFGTF